MFINAKKWMFILVGSIIMLAACNSSQSGLINDSNEQSSLFYINNSVLGANILPNSENEYEGYYLESFVPLLTTIEKLGLTIKEKSRNNFTIEGGEDLFIKLSVSENFFEYEWYTDKAFENVTHHGFGNCMKIEDTVYMMAKGLADMTNTQILQKGQDICIYTQDYYNKHIAINNKVGHLIEIAVFVNDQKVETPVYFNRENQEASGPDDMENYVLLKPVFEALGATVNVKEDTINIEHKSLESFKIHKSHVEIIKGGVYIPFANVRYIMEGSLRQDDYESMYLYSKDYERLDVPKSMEDCFKTLDKTLSEETKADIKNSNDDELIEKYHMELGLWIRNNWLNQDSRIVKVLLREADVKSRDDMSSKIILGYREYLNNK